MKAGGKEVGGSFFGGVVEEGVGIWGCGVAISPEGVEIGMGVQGFADMGVIAGAVGCHTFDQAPGDAFVFACAHNEFAAGGPGLGTWLEGCDNPPCSIGFDVEGSEIVIMVGISGFSNCPFVSCP